MEMGFHVSTDWKRKKLNKIDMTVGRKRTGFLWLTNEEWDILRFILIDGGRAYQGDEVEIVIYEKDVTHAFTKGDNG